MPATIVLQLLASTNLLFRRLLRKSRCWSFTSPPSRPMGRVGRRRMTTGWRRSMHSRCCSKIPFFGLKSFPQWISRWLLRWAEEVDFLAAIGKVVAKARTRKPVLRQHANLMPGANLIRRREQLNNSGVGRHIHSIKAESRRSLSKWNTRPRRLITATDQLKIFIFTSAQRVVGHHQSCRWSDLPESQPEVSRASLPACEWSKARTKSIPELPARSTSRP